MNQTSSSTFFPLDVLIVDDEALARSRMDTLLGDCKEPLVQLRVHVSSAAQALDALQKQRFDVVLLDIHMPGVGGLQLAGAIRNMERVPALIFVTAHTEHAVHAFELEAVDYLTKPVRLQRLEHALQKAARWLQMRYGASAPDVPDDALVIIDRGNTVRLPLREVVYFKAEQKYITVRTEYYSYLLDSSLTDLEEKYAGAFLRIHRNALVAKRMVRALEKFHDKVEGDGWAVRLQGVPELIAVSRRQLASVRELMTS